MELPLPRRFRFGLSAAVFSVAAGVPEAERAVRSRSVESARVDATALTSVSSSFFLCFLSALFPRCSAPVLASRGGFREVYFSQRQQYDNIILLMTRNNWHVGLSRQPQNTQTTNLRLRFADVLRFDHRLRSVLRIVSRRNRQESRATGSQAQLQEFGVVVANALAALQFDLWLILRTYQSVITII